ncbi:hypothetical protein SDSE_2111 [Streptococcus dysgalactiae subsp. equisimilis AC-2713]|uniref:Uncharacterized protein n=1 Tax=Streptococcus dysgalactiae subsp. equisimilis AC-2713 TaxID=759913 RepID=A0AB33R9K4_STREQ|nr:hypothetical protein SDSE_2111 [Streptococcus dysgalactiae subsp. equisimilis AC-2713]
MLKQVLKIANHLKSQKQGASLVLPIPKSLITCYNKKTRLFYMGDFT